ncbi:MAG: hypothetical protein K6U02_00405 [Firmicutes bacterium]|nr:hypothetical protein [Bacillota bacterium]
MRTGPSVWQQVGLVAELRWRLLRNSLRSERAQLELMGTLLIAGLGALVVLGGLLGFAAVSYAAVRRGSPQPLTILLWSIFLVWQLLPLVLAAFASGISFRGLLVLPLRFHTFFLLHLAHGVLDPAGITALAWLAGVLVGVGLAAPQGLAATALLLLGFALFSLLLNRLLYLWLERLLTRRRTREALFLAFILAMFGLQFVGLAAERWGRSAAPLLQQVSEWMQILPPGLVGTAVVDRGSPGTLLGALALLGAYAAGCGWFLRRRLLAQYRGEDVGETTAPRPAPPAKGKAVGELVWELPGVSPPVAAVFSKEVRYLWRNGVALLNLFVPLAFLVFLTMATTPNEGSGFLNRGPDVLFPMAVGYAVLVLAPIGYNSFAFDGRGIQFFLVAPVRFREVLLGKNLLLGLIWAVEIVVLWLWIGGYAGWPRPGLTLVTLAALAFVLLVHFSVGNYMSLAYPRRFDFGKFRQHQSGMTALVLMVTQLVVLGICTLIFLVAFRSMTVWLAGVVFVVLAALGGWLYGWSLEYSSRLAERMREVLTSELGKG